MKQCLSDVQSAEQRINVTDKNHIMLSRQVERPGKHNKKLPLANRAAVPVCS